MKYHNNLTKGSQDIERTSSGLPTDRQVQSNMPLFFEGGHNNFALEEEQFDIYFIYLYIVSNWEFLSIFWENSGHFCIGNGSDNRT